MMRWTVGCDPGLQGALAFFDIEAGVLEVEDMPTVTIKKGKGTARRIDLANLARIINTRAGEGIRHAYIERVSASPQMGVVSAFNFGFGYGALLGILAADVVPVTLVTPAEWKRVLHCPADKAGARLRASQLLPAHANKWTLVKHDGRAEAAMLAFYGATYAAP